MLSAGAKRTDHLVALIASSAEVSTLSRNVNHLTSLLLQGAFRATFAKIELSDNKFVMVLHDHQSNPRVHISVRAESKHGKRLNPRKADLHRWRETFAESLRSYGVEAEATRQEGRLRSSVHQIGISRREEHCEQPTATTPPLDLRVRALQGSHTASVLGGQSTGPIQSSAPGRAA